MKIKLIFTGGTIGSRKKGQFIGTDKSAKRLLLELYEKNSGKTCNFEEVEPFFVLSENMTGRYWRILVKAVAEALKGDFDGIIVTHGTDTLQYTASLLSYVFGSDTLPIILVSSSRPLDDPKSNGVENFSAAVDFIENKRGRGIFACYKNGGDLGVTFHRGSRLLPHLPFSDSFYSVKNRYYGVFDGKTFINNPEYKASPDSSPYGEGVKITDFCDDVVFLPASAGLSYPRIREGVKAVILGSYHSGTVRSEGKDFIEFTEDLRKRGIPLYLSGAEKDSSYKSTEGFSRLGVRLLPEASPIAMYVKLWLAVINGKDTETVFLPLGEDF